MTRRIALIPPVPALLSDNAGQLDPVAELRFACRGALDWLLADRSSEVCVIGDPLDSASCRRGIHTALAERVATTVLADVGFTGDVHLSPEVTARVDCPVLVLANGSARRSEKAPGHHDDRALDFDATVETALRAGDGETLTRLDTATGADLLVAGIEPLRALGALLKPASPGDVRYAGDPYGVRYWVVVWQCVS